MFYVYMLQGVFLQLLDHNKWLNFTVISNSITFLYGFKFDTLILEFSFLKNYV